MSRVSAYLAHSNFVSVQNTRIPPGDLFTLIFFSPSSRLARRQRELFFSVVSGCGNGAKQATKASRSTETVWLAVGEAERQQRGQTGITGGVCYRQDVWKCSNGRLALPPKKTIQTHLSLASATPSWSNTARKSVFFPVLHTPSANNMVQSEAHSASNSREDDSNIPTHNPVSPQSGQRRQGRRKSNEVEKRSDNVARALMKPPHGAGHE